MVFFADIVRDVARELIMSTAMNDFVSSDRSDMEVIRSITYALQYALSTLLYSSCGHE